MAIKWTENLAVGISVIDAQHQELVKRIGEFQEACQRRQGPEHLKKLYEFLRNYVEEHFQTEERYMKKYEYPATDEHVRQHDWFRKEFFSLKDKLEDVGSSSDDEVKSLGLVIRTAALLTDWFINHIAGSDKKMGLFLREKGC